MFDPTIFENLKVAVENHIYDLDNLDGRVVITHRIDRLEMAIMARVFALQFTLAKGSGITAEFRLEASLKDLAAELLGEQGTTPGCTLRVRFYMPIEEVERTCAFVERKLADIWQPEIPPTQTISYLYGERLPVCQNEIELSFNRKINEEQMEDLPELIDHILQTLEALEAHAAEKQ